MKIKYKLKEFKPNSAGMPDRGEGSRHENVGLEECGCDMCQGNDEYGASSGNPDRDGDGVYSPLELYYHFDLNQNGEVLPDEYEQHVKWHERNPEVFNYDEEEMIYEKKDRCYRLAKKKYDVFPSAYASGFIVRCRKGKVAKKKS